MTTASPKNDRPVSQPIVTSATLSAALAVILTVEIVALAIFTYYRITAALAPERLADRVEAAIEQNYPEVRTQLVAEVKQEAPEIAAQVSRELIAAAPAGREELEELARRQIAYGLDEATELSAEQFRELLQKNRKEFIQVFEAIEDAPEEARRIVLGAEKQIEQDFGVDIQRQARGALRVHRQLNDKLQRLADADARLTPQELLEQRMVRILRTIQLRESQRLAETPNNPSNPSTR